MISGMTMPPPMIPPMHNLPFYFQENTFSGHLQLHNLCGVTNGKANLQLSFPMCVRGVVETSTLLWQAEVMWLLAPDLKYLLGIKQTGFLMERG